jgi:hypothetical protein
MRKHELGRSGYRHPLQGSRFQRHQLACDAVGSERREQIQLAASRRFRAMVREVDDLALRRPFNSGMGCVDEARQAFRYQ